MADQKLSALPVATTPSGTELIYLVQGGVSKQSTVSAIASTPTLQQVLTAGSTLAGNNTATGIGDLTLGTDDPGVYTSTIKTSGSTILHTSDNGVDTGLFTQTPTNNTFTKSVTALSFIKTGGLSTQFLKADGTVDSSTYLTTLGTAATSLTTTGSSGAATLIANVLNVPNYTLAGLGGTTLAAVNAQNLSVFAATTSAQLAGVISDETGSGALVFGTSPTFTTDITTPQITGVSGNLTLTNAIQSSGAITQFTFTNVANTNQTLGANIPNFRVTGANKQWATGALATQYFNYFTNNTIAFVGASTATDSYNTYIESVVAGTNATLTRKYSLGTSDNVAFGIANSFATLHLGVAPSASNYMLSNAAGAGSTYLNAPTGGFVVVSIGGANRFQVNNSSISFNPITATATNATTCYTFAFSSNTNQTLSTEIPGVLYNNYSRNWATGNITTQREQYIKTVTYTAIAASVITNAFGKYIEAPTAGTNITINNNFALGLAGSLKINDTFNIVFDTTTGSKIMTSNLQKGAFWGATPIVQPAAVTTVQGFYDAIASTGLIASGTITLPTGYARSFNNIAINTTGAAAANTDYYYFCTATLTFTLPTAVGNTNTYYIKVTSGTLTINTTSSQTIDGSLTITTSVANTAFTLISDGTNWQII